MPHNFFDLSGRVAVVTGASRGLGQYFARALAKAGARLAVSARNAKDCGQFVTQMKQQGAEIKAYPLDVRSINSINAFTAQVLKDFSKVDVLVNNAGCNIRRNALDISEADWDTVLDTNLKGSFFVAKAFAPAMIGAGFGRIINIGSVTSVFGYGGLASYCASRGGILQLTRALADEWGKHSITVNCLAPGWFKTEQNKVLYENRQWVEYICDRIPLKRPGQPEDLDGAIVFLASEASRYMTGQLLLIDGGISTGATKATI